MGRTRFTRLAVALALAVPVGAVAGAAGVSEVAAACSISTTYRQGMSGAGVNCIERRLQALRFQTSYIDFYYGSVTTRAVSTFQAARGLPVTGVVNQATGQALGIWATAGAVNPRIQEQRIIGYSVKGRPIVAYRLGSATGIPVLAVGNIHGDEPRGQMMVNYMLTTAAIPANVQLWVIRTVNPDGTAAHLRDNAHHVDLNRNFDGGDWVRSGAGTEKYSGPSAASEPETRATQNFLQSIQPRVVIWWHQVGQHVDDNRGVANYPLLQRYAQLTGYPVQYTTCGPYGCTGNATHYVNHRIPGSTSFVVEMPSYYTSAVAARHARAFLTIASES